MCFQQLKKRQINQFNTINNVGIIYLSAGRQINKKKNSDIVNNVQYE